MESLYCLTNRIARTLLPSDLLNVDASYQDFCNIIKKAAKKTISRCYRNNYIPCWDAECESLSKTFLRFSQGNDSSLAVTASPAKLNRKQRDQRSEAVGSYYSNHVLHFGKLQELGGDFKPRPDYTFSISPDLEVEA